MESGSRSANQPTPAGGALSTSAQPWIEDFASGDYYACYWRTRPLVAQCLPHEALQLMLISLQRLGLRDELAVASVLALQATTESAWHQGLVKVTLGEREFTSFSPEARTPEQQCQLLFYAGARQATLGGGTARALFDRCQRTGAQIVESRLAAIEATRAETPDGTRSVELNVSDRLRTVAALLQRRQYDQAKSVAGHALIVSRDELGGDHLLTAACFDSVGCALSGTQNVPSQAATVALHEQAMAIRLKAFGKGAPETNASLQNVGLALANQGRNEAALGYLAEALELRRKLLGENHIGTATTIVCVARVLRRLGDEASASNCFNRCHAIYERLFGQNHPATNAAAQELRQLTAHAPSDTAPANWLERAKRIRWERFGEDDPAAAGRLSELAQLFERANDVRGACFYLQRALAIYRTCGSEPVATSKVLVELGLQLRTMGERAEARRCFEESLVIRRRHFGDDHEATIVSLRNLAVLLEEMDDPVAAIPYVAAEVDALGRLPGDHRQDLAELLEHLGGLRSETHQLSEARSCFEEALSLRRDSSAGKPLPVATTLAMLAATLSKLREYARARSCLEEALDLQRRAGQRDESMLATTLRQLGNVEMKLEEFASARQHIEEAMSIRVPPTGETFDVSASDRYVLSIAMLQLGQYEPAREQLEHAWSILQGHGGEKDPLAGKVLCALGLAMRGTGKYAEARRYLERSLAIRRDLAGDNQLETSESLHNLGLVLEDLDDPATAIESYSQALVIRRSLLGVEDQRTLATMNAVAVLLKNAGLYDEARPHYELALTTLRRVHGDEHAATVTALANWGAFLYVIGDWDAALESLRQGLRIGRRLWPDGHGLHSVLHTLALLLTDLNDYDSARNHFEEALALVRTASAGRLQEESAVLFGMARLYERWKRPQEALHALEEAAQVENYLIGQAFWSGSERQRTLALHDSVVRFYSYLSLVAREFPHDPAAVRGAFDMLLRRKGLSAEATAVQRDAVLRRRNPALQFELETLAFLRAEIASLMLEGSGKSDAADAHEHRLKQLQARRDELESQLAESIPELKLDRAFRTVDADTVSRAVPAGHTLVELVRCPLAAPRWTLRETERASPTHYLAFVLPSSGSAGLELIDLGDAGPIDVGIAEVRKHSGPAGIARDIPAVQTPGSSDGEAPARLRARIFDPIAARVGPCRRLVIAPDGDLNRLPFEILPAPNGKPLIDSWHFSYVAVARDLLRLTTASSHSPGKAIVAADPNYDLATSRPSDPSTECVTPPEEVGIERTAEAVRGSAEDESAHRRLRGEFNQAQLRFGSLPNTRPEAEDVATILGVSARTGDEVTKRLIQSSQAPWILHLATHGFFLESPPLTTASVSASQIQKPLPGRLAQSNLENPLLRSGLALAGANSWLSRLPLPVEAGNGLLTAEDVSALDLLDTELVVLSACDTGLGTESFSDGVMGLRRSFALAGARTVVMSLWKVPDAETRELMVDFYRRLRTGAGRADALRAAQLQVRKTHPGVFFWGAFICLGDPRPLGASSSFAGTDLSRT